MTIRPFVVLLLETGALVDLTRVPARTTASYDFLPYLAGTAALIVIVAAYFTWRHRRRRDDEPAIGAAFSTATGALDADQRARLNRAMMEGEYASAGDLLREAGRLEEAAECYARAGSVERAAACYREAGDLLQAVYYLKEAGDRREAAKLYAERGEYRAAAAEFVEAREPRLAAKYYEKAGDAVHAAERYAAVGERRKAAANYEEAGEPGRAAREYGRLLEHELETSGGEATETAVRYARQAGRCFGEAGDHEEAARVYEEVGELERAASMYAEAGDASRAADLLLEAGEVDEAVELLQEAGEDERAYRAQGELAYESGEFRQAASAFQRSGDVDKAAELYARALDSPSRAAELYEEGEHWLEASRCWEEANRVRRAAKCAEEGGDLKRAVELYHRAGETEAEVRVRGLQGDYFRAGHILYEEGQLKEALEMLQKINPRDPIQSKALELQGDVYRVAEHLERAYKRYREALESRESGTEALPLYYKMARILESREEWERASRHYQKILEIDESYEDVADRYQAIREGLTPSGDLEEPVEGGAESQVGLREGSEVSGFAQAGEGGEGADVRYEFVEELARGGMGVVYEARDTFLNRIVAVKVLGEDLRDNERAVKYFLREARAAAALAHPNIVTIFDAGEQRGEYYIAMEFVEGETLKERTRRGERLTESQLRHVLIEACKALDYAHGEEILHRDVKSGNIMYRPEGSVKIMDFGLAKFLREYQQDHTQQIGTPYYMSPEQIIGESIDFRADLYGLGCTAFECITGRVPFDEGELAYHHVHTEPPAPSEFNPEISDEMEAVILRLLEKDPDDRFESARALLEVLAG